MRLIAPNIGMSNNIFPNKYILITATILSSIMLAPSLVPSLFPTAAFGASEVGGVIVDHSVQTATQTASNINVDPDVILSVGCGEISDDDEVTQVNDQDADQEVDKNNEVGIGGVIVAPSVQTLVQTAVNVNVDRDVFIILGCNEGDLEISDDDEVTQVNDQDGNQEVDNDSEGGKQISPTEQTKEQNSINHNEDENHVIMIPFPDVLESN
jgi:hypothetical protein